MNNVTAVLSMLHEPPDASASNGLSRQPLNSANRVFRQDPVLAWTIDRLHRSERLGSVAILCWDDQIDSVKPIADEMQAHVLMKSPRVRQPLIEAISAAQRWADGWRGGLLGTCEFDRGFFAPWVMEIVSELGSDAALLVDPASGLIDAEIIDNIIERAASKPEADLVFTQAAPGLAGALVRPALLERLATAHSHPGRVLSYMPQQPVRDAIAGDWCVTVPTPVARTTARFKLDSDRQIRRITEASVSLNGTLISTSAEELVARVSAYPSMEPLPREVVFELTTRRATRAIFRPSGIERADLTTEAANPLIEELAQLDDSRLTLAGAGDPLLCRDAISIIDAAHRAGIHAIHVETDLLIDTNTIDKLAETPIDLISVQLPATTAATYQAVMGVDRFGEVIENIRRLVTRRAELRRSVPLVVPVFTKCRVNLAEMEHWYDQWLSAVGCAVIAGPSDFAGLIEDVGVGQMCPPRRTACARLATRLTVLCDQHVVACENDVRGSSIVGRIGEQTLTDIWQKRLAPLRSDHAAGSWNNQKLCAGCDDWYRV
jgi:MoaA/NifB/PqqE/SkfB family radical SAM enzyme